MIVFSSCFSRRSLREFLNHFSLVLNGSFSLIFYGNTSGAKTLLALFASLLTLSTGWAIPYSSLSSLCVLSSSYSLRGLYRIGLYNCSRFTLTHDRQKTKSDIRIMSSKFAQKTPSSFSHTTPLISPLIPETVFILAPINFYTSKDELNMFLIKAVFLNIFTGSPINLSFFFKS